MPGRVVAGPVVRDARHAHIGRVSGRLGQRRRGLDHGGAGWFGFGAGLAGRRHPHRLDMDGLGFHLKN